MDSVHFHTGPRLLSGESSLLATIQSRLTTDTLGILLDLTRRHKRHREVSLRLIEYFCNNYCKAERTQIKGNNIHNEYCLWQTTFKRPKFGAFKRVADRWQPVEVEWGSHRIQSSVAQLNFALFCQQMGNFTWIFNRDNFVKVAEHRRVRQQQRPKLGKRRRVLNPGRSAPFGSTNTAILRPGGGTATVE